MVTDETVLAAIREVAAMIAAQPLRRPATAMYACGCRVKQLADLTTITYPCAAHDT